jgi:hypothetical protein
VLVGVELVYPHVAALSPFLRRTLGGALVLALLVPWVLFETFSPRYVDVLSSPDGPTTFAFASADYALEFRALNERHVVPDVDD